MSKVPLELEVQSIIEKWLDQKGLWAFSVLYVAATKKHGDLLKITFLMHLEVQEFLDYLDYKDLADRSGIEVIEETSTVLLSGLGIRKFFKVLEEK